MQKSLGCKVKGSQLRCLCDQTILCIQIKPLQGNLTVSFFTPSPQIPADSKQAWHICTAELQTSDTCSSLKCGCSLQREGSARTQDTGWLPSSSTPQFLPQCNYVPWFPLETCTLPAPKSSLVTSVPSLTFLDRPCAHGCTTPACLRTGVLTTCKSELKKSGERHSQTLVHKRALDAMAVRVLVNGVQTRASSSFRIFF